MRKAFLIITLVVLLIAAGVTVATATVSHGNLLVRFLAGGVQPVSMSSTVEAGDGSLRVEYDSSSRDANSATQALESRIRCEQQDNAASSNSSSSY